MALSCVLGIDPGAKGAIAILSTAGELLQVFDMPVTKEANGRSATSAPLLAGIIASSQCTLIFCEFIASRPTDAKVAAFAFGRARGVIEGIAGAYDLPVVFIAPRSWKAYAQVPPGRENKDIARTRAIARWPAHAESFAKKGDVDRAEAAFIAAAGLQRRQGAPTPC